MSGRDEPAAATAPGGSIGPVGLNRREAPRYGVDMAAAIRAYRQPPIDAKITDISTGGALVEATAPDVRRGDEVLLDLGWSEFVVTVAWATEGFLGVTFHRPLDAVELAEIRKRGRRRP